VAHSVVWSLGNRVIQAKKYQCVREG